jgi:lysozyme
MANIENAIEKLSGLCKKFEGYYPKAYLCPAKIWTISWGHTGGIKPNDTATLEQSTEYLNSDMVEAVNGALRCCPVLAIYPDRLSSIADFVFNLGETRLKASTLRKKINEENWIAAQQELKKWVWGGGKKLSGLVLRREVEGRLII